MLSPIRFFIVVSILLAPTSLVFAQNATNQFTVTSHRCQNMDRDLRNTRSINLSKIPGNIFNISIGSITNTFVDFAFSSECASFASKQCKHGEVECTAGEASNGTIVGPVYAKCVCCTGWTGELCDLPCSLECGPHGSCYNDGEIEICKCSENYTRIGNFCEITKSSNAPPVTPTEKITSKITEKAISTTVRIETPVWLMVVLSLVIFLFVMMLVVVPYCMYKKRVELVMNFAYYFRQYEDDDNKDIDAFVSYCSDGSDEQFVVHKLRPKLEQEFNFKLCLHFRDFVPGESIVDNIANFIEKSRRSILVISPRYLESAYCRMEYELAHEHMIRLKQKIIPIILEDIDDAKVDKNLSLLLKTVTYEKWPSSDSMKQETFWRKLLLSMPKKKHKDNINMNMTVIECTPSSS